VGLIQRLVDGLWDEEEFLVVPPGFRVAPGFDEKILRAEARMTRARLLSASSYA